MDIYKVNKNIFVIKRNGDREPLNLDKIHKVVAHACDGLQVSASELELQSHIQFFDGIQTRDIQEVLIRAAGELISDHQPDYQYVGGRLINYHLRKEVYRSITPPPLRDIVKTNIQHGFYDGELLEAFSTQEWQQLDNIIKHERDNNLTLAAMEVFRGKYLVKNRNTDTFYETPQVAFMLISATLFQDELASKRMSLIKDYYNAISLHKLSLPTPIMAGVRTPQRQFSSCVVIDSGDSLDSISAAATAIVKYVSQRAGIGINGGRIRALDSPIRGGQATHTGVIPFYKHFQSAIKSCSQGGVRGGAGTLFFPCWHLDFEEMVVLKNNKGIEDTRIRHIDYCVQFNKLFYQRLIENKDITLFCPHEVPGLYETFYTDADAFQEIYESAESNPNIRKKSINSLDFFNIFMEERKSTGRIYVQNVDHTNNHGSFYEPIYQSNLCMEITLPTRPAGDEGLISLCTLSAINWGNIRKDEFPHLARLCVRALDNLLEYQNYPLDIARKGVIQYRPLGIGINNLAYWLVKNKSSYEEPNLPLIGEWMEAMSYALIKASADLAMERGACMMTTKYDDGIVPLDSYKQAVDELVPHEEQLDWEALKVQLRDTGIRNATLMAVMPCETSALVMNATNGIEPPRALVSTKANKHGLVKQVVPEIKKYKNKYNLLWDQKSPRGYLSICAVLQKYIDQSISANTSYNPIAHGELTSSQLLGDLLYCYKYGLKTLYYFNTHDGQGEINVDQEEDCTSCQV